MSPALYRSVTEFEVTSGVKKESYYYAPVTLQKGFKGTSSQENHNQKYSEVFFSQVRSRSTRHRSGAGVVFRIRYISPTSLRRVTTIRILCLIALFMDKSNALMKACSIHDLSR